MPDHCCIYHAIIEALDAYAEAHSPTNVDDIMDALITVTAEFVAMHGDAKVRKSVAKREMEKLTQRVREFRAIGRYPGGPASGRTIMTH